MRVRESIEIARPPDEVSSFVSDRAKEGRWLVAHGPVRRDVRGQLRALKRLLERSYG
jgi:hypothetical protein